MKCVVLSSTVPDPRMLKRIRSLKKLFSEIYLFFWSRTHGNGSVYNEIQGVHHFEILSTDTPNLIHRFFENKKLIRKTIDIVMENVKDISLIYVNGVEMLEVAKC
ncbi:MAG: hypothetical protein N2254_09670, partial [bacterium]|nr:hypothetical protein [bacterium]